MADSKANESVAKQRIVTHMNKDHQDSLIRYLEYFCQLSSFSARNAYLTDITFDHLIISTNKTPHTIPIRPPMTSWSDARPRVVAMDAEAVAGLKRSNITVKRYEGPNLFQAVPWVIYLFFLALLSRKSNFQPGSLAYDSVWRYAPGFARWCLKIRIPTLIFLILIHPGEALYMGLIHSKKHSVPMFSTLWWKWTLSVLIGGYGEFVRFNQIVEEEEKAKLSAKH